MPVNRTLRLKQRPQGPIAPSFFDIRDEPIVEPGEGQFRVRAQYVSLDPAMRGWMSEGRSYVKPVGLGDVMRAFTVGSVEATRHPDFKEGDVVVGLFGVQTHAISDGTGVTRADLSIAPEPTWLGGLGMPGLTAYFGLIEVAQPNSGETVVVSAASGAVGQVVGQIAKLKGCRVVGIAGGPDKCAWLVDELGFDAAIDYRNESVKQRLKAACPSGVNVFFDNVGGSILNDVLARIALHARVVICGGISRYQAEQLPPGPANYMNLVFQRATMSGFLMSDYLHEAPMALERLTTWIRGGELKYREDVQVGLENAPATLLRLFEGKNFGKQLLKLS